MDSSGMFAVGILLVLGAVTYYFLNVDNKSNAETSLKSKATSNAGDDILIDAGSVKDQEPNSMREVEVAEGMKVLLVRTRDGEYYATGSKCPHYGAALKNGVLSDDRIVCPWHAASFDCKTGDIEDGPVLDCLPTYKVKKNEKGKLQIRIPKVDKLMKRVPKLSKKEKDNTKTFIVVGGGPAGGAAVETLRAEGFTGRVVLITKEDALPYDRPKLSKNMEVEISKIQFRNKKFYDDANIEILLGTSVNSVDFKASSLTLGSGAAMKYDGLLLATGTYCRSFRAPERFVIEGAELGNIFTLRLPSDALSIEKECLDENVKVVIIGSSFIGLEAASYLSSSKKIKSITVIGMEKVPLERVLGVEIGQAIMDLHKSKGITFILESVASKFEGKNGKVNKVFVKNVVVNDIHSIDADVVIVGAGVIPATEFLKNLELGPMGAVKCDEEFKVKGTSNVWAAGDIAMYPYFITGEDIRVEHFDVAMQQGRVAAKNMMGMGIPFHTVPFFWTSQFGTTIRYAGHGMQVDRRIFVGSVSSLKFVCYFLTGNVVSAICTVNADPVAVAGQELMRLGKMPSVDQLAKGGLMYLADKLKEL